MLMHGIVGSYCNNGEQLWHQNAPCIPSNDSVFTVSLATHTTLHKI